ncbi:MAG: hypothetical protein M3O87_07805 [Candidatus Dormibacteraeota bacterium]|nr:hypothetical protein [Candidatus Dormibacteraeota bacterium]
MSRLRDQRQTNEATGPRRPGVGRGLRGAAFIGVLTLAAGAVVGVAILVVRQPSPAAPTATVQSPSPANSPPGNEADSGIRDHGAPPVGTPVVYVAYPEKPWWLHAVAWDGRIVGTVKLPEAVGPSIYHQGTILNAVKASPDGSLVRVQGSVYDQGGRLVGTLGENSASAAWGDDNRLICGMRYETDSSSGLITPVLWLAEPGKPSRNIVHFNPAPAGDAAYEVDSCAPSRDRALVTVAGISRSQWWLYRLSDGRLLQHQALESDHYLSVVSSADATLTAANAAFGPGAAPSTLVQRTADGTTVAEFPGGQVLAFSGDSRRLMLFHGPEDMPTYEVRGLTDPAQTWRYGGPDYLAAGITEPGGQGFALALVHREPQLAPCQDLTGRNCPQSQSALDAVVIVQPDGSEVYLGDGLIPGW